jgi:plastocyanin
VKRFISIAVLIAIAALAGCRSPEAEMGNLHQELNPASFYLPNAEASRVVSVTTNGVAAAQVLVQTQRVAVKETGPKETVEKFGEIYAFSPNFFAVHKDEPTRIRFWNLQPDDNHGFMLMSPNSQVLMNAHLPPLEETGWVFTFHQEGLYRFACSMHPNAMFGQILVLPPVTPQK